MPGRSAGPGRSLAHGSAIVLGGVTVALLAASPATRWWARLQRVRDPDYGDDLPLLFDVNTEGTIPTWYSAGLLLAVAATCGLLAVLGRATPAGGVRWSVLAAVFTAMSLDEAVALHERLGPKLASGLGLAESGLLRHSWVVAGAVLAVGLAAVVVWAVASLPGRLRRGVVTGLGVYVVAALGVEAVSGAVLDAWGNGLAYAAVTLVEEGAEMAGIIAVLCALVAVIEVRWDGHGLRVGLADPSVTARSVDLGAHIADDAAVR